jgi:hypothetical protein
MTAFARAPVLPEGTSLGALSALLRRSGYAQQLTVLHLLLPVEIGTMNGRRARASALPARWMRRRQNLPKPAVSIPRHTTCAHPYGATPGPSAQAIRAGAKASDSSIQIAALTSLAATGLACRVRTRRGNCWRRTGAKGERGAPGFLAEHPVVAFRLENLVRFSCKWPVAIVATRCAGIRLVSASTPRCLGINVGHGLNMELVVGSVRTNKAIFNLTIPTYAPRLSRS